MKQFEKYLTTHLYRKDEVLSALRWAIVNHNIRESVYWGLELFDSDMEQDALEMLEFIWITEIGLSSITFLNCIIDIYKRGELDRNTWIHMLNNLSRVSQRDSTILYLLIRGSTIAEDWTPVFVHSLTYTSVKEAVYDTLRRGKVLEAWILARAMTPESQWLLIDELSNNKNRQEPLMIIKSSNLSDCEKRVASFVVLSLDDQRRRCALEPMIERELPSEVKESIDEWDSEESLRKRRVYRIRSEALLYLTDRSSQERIISSEQDIQDNLLQTLLESPYWIDILDGYMKNGKWKSDSYLEMFYETYFIGDIPDEWSSQDREKSHGRGLDRKTEVGLKRFLDALFERLSAFETRNYIKLDKYMDTMNWDSIYNELQHNCQVSLESQLPLKAKKKIFEII
jgi:hypothetical protein